MSAANGGPAFPVDQIIERDEKGRMNGHEISSAGMTMRDYFAGQALQGLCANPGGPFQANPMSGWGFVNCTGAQIAIEAYALADDMLAARKGGAS